MYTLQVKTQYDVLETSTELDGKDVYGRGKDIAWGAGNQSRGDVQRVRQNKGMHVQETTLEMKCTLYMVNDKIDGGPLIEPKQAIQYEDHVQI